MAEPFLDTDVIVRLLAADDPRKQAAAQVLFERIEQGSLTVAAPDTVIADAVYVLTSPRLYHQPRKLVAAALIRLVRLPHFRVKNRRAVLRALELYASTNLDFGDVLIVSSMEQAGSTMLYSYDKGFDRIMGVTRHEP